ncbi:DUF1449 family protein [Oleomonas cavernae]|uniref:DUF1449 family protein n=1 Tax=Oleomonas cavernae TaxID=2320859 RepID=A0A418W9M6_9PROT|nr:YqiJ family protein [Oleomonas cavernae]RJF86676.1 DUF1449 family protein [Oleomonas cavernae]
MIHEIFSGPNTPFAIAIVFLVALVAIELIGTLTGLSLSGHGDHADAPHVDGDAGVFDWLGLGKVPLLILIAEFCAAFAAIGLSLQAIIEHFSNGVPLTAWLAGLVTLPPAIFATRWLSIGVARVLPREETEAVTQDSLVGRIAEVTTGTARSGSPAEARVRDAHGHTHYVRVRPAIDSESHPPGTRVVLLAREGTVYTAAAMPDADKI